MSLDKNIAVQNVGVQSRPTATNADNKGKRIGVFIVAYNAVTTLSKVLKRIPDEVWQNKKCSTCHEWTKEALCTQAGTYAGSPERVARIAHPYGGPFKEFLALWSAQGCR